MRKTALNEVLNLARQDERVCFVGSDLGFGVMDEFCQEFPTRIFKEGISEQHLISMSAGLALEGKVVYFNTIASFYRRCYEQIYLDLAFTKAKVRLIGSGGGLVYAPLGPTHLACDDLAIFRAIPNLEIIAPCDAVEMRKLFPQTLNRNNPIYIRLAKGGDEIITSESDQREWGKGVLFSQYSKVSKNKDVLFVSTGTCTQLALKASQQLAVQGLNTTVLHLHTIMPLDAKLFLQESANYNKIITIEEHQITGGLGSAIAELMIDRGIYKNLTRLALPDQFFSEHGSQNNILQQYGINVENIIRTALI